MYSIQFVCLGESKTSKSVLWLVFQVPAVLVEHVCGRGEREERRDSSDNARKGEFVTRHLSPAAAVLCSCSLRVYHMDGNLLAQCAAELCAYVLSENVLKIHTDSKRAKNGA